MDWIFSCTGNWFPPAFMQSNEFFFQFLVFLFSGCDKLSSSVCRICEFLISEVVLVSGCL